MGGYIARPTYGARRWNLEKSRADCASRRVSHQALRLASSAKTNCYALRQAATAAVALAAPVLQGCKTGQLEARLEALARSSDACVTWLLGRCEGSSA